VGTILPQIAKNRKPTVGIWYAFFEKRCILRPFFGPPPKRDLQPAHNQSFANESKTGHLFDKDDFSDDAIFGHLRHNTMKINKLDAESAWLKALQIGVKKNTWLWRNSKNVGVLVNPEKTKWWSTSGVPNQRSPCSYTILPFIYGNVL
jgi:hypothetical protein